MSLLQAVDPFKDSLPYECFWDDLPWRDDDCYTFCFGFSKVTMVMPLMVMMVRMIFMVRHIHIHDDDITHHVHYDGDDDDVYD